MDEQSIWAKSLVPLIMSKSKIFSSYKILNDKKNA